MIPSVYVPNIIKFKGKPFLRDTTVHRYHDKSGLDFSELGRVCRGLRSIEDNAATTIIQDGPTIVASEIIIDDDHSWLTGFQGNKEIVNPTNEFGRAMIRHLVAESVAVQLRNRPNEKWIVGQVSGEIYEVKRWDEAEEYGPLVAYPGFHYAPLVKADGEAGLILDPRYKLHSRLTLRELHANGDRRLRDLFRVLPLPQEDMDAAVVDTCPVDDCPEKANTHSTCKLAGMGNNARLIQIVHAKPSSRHVKGRNLLEYHDDERICTRRPKLAQVISDIEPVAVVQYHGGGIYEIPLERLRLRPAFNAIPEPNRSALMKRVRPAAQDRLRRTRMYIKAVGNVAFGSQFDLELDSPETKWVNRSTERFASSYYVGAQATRVEFPELRIRDSGPYDVDNEAYRSVNLLIVHSEPELPPDMDDIIRIFSGKTAVVPTIREYLRLICNIIDVIGINETNLESVLKLILRLNSEKANLAVLVLHGPEGNYQLLGSLKSVLNIEDISKQGINLEEFRNNLDNRRKNYFYNVYLGLYTKLGGQPWSVVSDSDGDFEYVGYSSRSAEDRLAICMCRYDSSGKFLGGLCKNLPKDVPSENLETEIKTFLGTGEHLVLLKAGTLVSREDRALRSLLDSKAESGILEVLSGYPIRIYSTEEGSQGQPEAGCGLWLSDRELALVTTEPTVGTPNPIVVRNVSMSERVFTSILPTVYNLTQSYTGYTGTTTRIPLPCYAASRSLERFLGLQVETLPFRKPWFI